MSETLTSYPLVTAERVRRLLSDSQTSPEVTDDEVNLGINFASSFAEEFTGRRLYTRTYSASTPDDIYIDGDGTDSLQLPEYPVTAIAGLVINADEPRVWTNGADAVSTTLDLRPGYGYNGRSKTGLLRLWNNFSEFALGAGSVRIYYTAGYAAASIPAELALAVGKLAVLWIRASKNQTHHMRSRVSPGGIGGTIEVFEDMPKDVEAVLSRYRRFDIVGV